MSRVGEEGSKEAKITVTRITMKSLIWFMSLYPFYASFKFQAEHTIAYLLNQNPAFARSPQVFYNEGRRIQAMEWR